MSNRKKAFIVFFISIILLVGGYVLTYPQSFALCGPKEYSCISTISFSYGEPLLSVALFGLLPIAILLVLFPFVWNAWKKFAIWYIPLAALIIASMPVSGGTTYMPGMDKEVTTWFLAGFYTLISVYIIVRAVLKNHKTF